MSTLYRDTKHIHNQSAALAGEQLSFLGGRSLGDVDIFIESGKTRRKVRRIIEKRVCQDMHRNGLAVIDNYSRFHAKRRVSNQFKNIYGGVPAAFEA